MVLVEGNNHKQLMTQERLREKRMKQRHKAAVAFSEQDARERRSGTRSWRGREMLQRSASESEIGRVGMANAMEGWRRCKAGRRPSCASSFALQLVCEGAKSTRTLPVRQAVKARLLLPTKG
jgi:hypothetical protein